MMLSRQKMGAGERALLFFYLWSLLPKESYNSVFFMLFSFDGRFENSILAIQCKTCV